MEKPKVENLFLQGEKIRVNGGKLNQISCLAALSKPNQTNFARLIKP
uniref:Uncharacterized protein n=1 Tax=Medicago truncatula TaxID=3880 RepID=B7FG73_MEDTR|nr:unknown [Medicago truncatula]